MRNINIKLTVTNGLDENYSSYYVLTVQERIEISEVEAFIMKFKDENDDYTADDIMNDIAEHFNESCTELTFAINAII